MIMNSLPEAIGPEPDPIELDPRPCDYCGLTIAQHPRVHDGDGPVFYCQLIEPGVGVRGSLTRLPARKTISAKDTRAVGRPAAKPGGDYLDIVKDRVLPAMVLLLQVRGDSEIEKLLHATLLLMLSSKVHSAEYN